MSGAAFLEPPFSIDEQNSIAQLQLKPVGGFAWPLVSIPKHYALFIRMVAGEVLPSECAQDDLSQAIQRADVVVLISQGDTANAFMDEIAEQIANALTLKKKVFSVLVDPTAFNEWQTFIEDFRPKTPAIYWPPDLAIEA